jgi:ribosomal protein L36
MLISPPLPKHSENRPTTLLLGIVKPIPSVDEVILRRKKLYVLSDQPRHAYHILRALNRLLKRSFQGCSAFRMVLLCFHDSAAVVDPAIESD